MDGCAVVEFHGFRGNSNEFILKEIAIVDSNNRYTLLFFKSPYDRQHLTAYYRRMVNWLEKYYHGITWEYGEFTYSDDTVEKLLSIFSTLYTKGLEKANYLRKFHSNVQQLNDTLAKPQFEKIEALCPVHASGRCSLKSGIHYMNLLKRQYDYTRESCRLDSFQKSDLPVDKCIEYAKKGFYFDANIGGIICAWCDDDMKYHTACVSYYVNNIPIEYDEIIRPL